MLLDGRIGCTCAYMCAASHSVFVCTVHTACTKCWTYAYVRICMYVYVRVSVAVVCMYALTVCTVHTTSY